MQKQYVEKPGKILAEQYHASASPPALGVCTLPDDPGYRDGSPHVHTAIGALALHETDMIVASHYDQGVFLDVIPLAEFEDRYGNVPGDL